MRKSSSRTSNYRPGSSRNAASLDTFRQQMADFARGQRLKELREDAHLSQEDAAHKIGVSTKSVRVWEKGGKIKWANAKKAAALYKVDAESLVTREEGVASWGVASDEEPQLDRIEAKLDLLIDHWGIGQGATPYQRLHVDDVPPAPPAELLQPPEVPPTTGDTDQGDETDQGKDAGSGNGRS